jgi:Mg2+/Co2+ transporter CorC
VRDKKVEGIAELRDESDRDGMRVAVDLKRDAIADIVLNQLFKHTQLEVSYPVQMLSIIDGQPKTLGMRPMLEHFIDFRREVVTRRTRWELDEAEKRFHILAGLLTALDDIDRIIEIIRGSPDTDEAKVRLCAERFPGAAKLAVFASAPTAQTAQWLAQGYAQLDEIQAAAILENAVEFGDTTVGAVMTPRPAIEGIEYTDDIAAIRDFARRSGHSRIPVYRGSLDHVDGILYVKDLVPLLGADAAGFRLRPFLRAPQRVPESKPLREQLRDFQQSKVHFAVVVDEFGGTSGILTIEDVIEELVGEIRDEHEPATDVHPVALRAADGWIEASGRLPIGDLGAALDAELPEDEGYETVAGFVLARFGSIPRRGDAFESQGIRFEVLEATPSAVIKVRARRASAD